MLRLPARGTAYVVSDLHGHLLDFRAIVDAIELIPRLEAGEQVHLVLLGDAGDLERHRWIDKRVSEDDDARLFDLLIELERRFPAHVHYIEGNHDFHVLRIFEELRSFQQTHGVSGHPDKTTIQGYFNEFTAEYGEACFRVNLEPYDFVWRARPRHLAYMARSRLMALAPNGLVCVHAGPGRRDSGRMAPVWLDRAFRERCLRLVPERMMASLYYQLLNNRYPNDYSLDDLRAFLTAVGGSIMVSGHSPLPQFRAGPNATIDGCAIHHGLISIGGQQAVLGSSYGCLPGQKRFLAFDLAKPYTSIEDLVPGQEILDVPKAHRPSILDDSAEIEVPNMVEVFELPQETESSEGRA